MGLDSRSYVIFFTTLKKEAKEKCILWQKLGEFVASGPALQGMLKDVFQRDHKWYMSEIQIYIKKERMLDKE